MSLHTSDRSTVSEARSFLLPRQASPRRDLPGTDLPGTSPSSRVSWMTLALTLLTVFLCVGPASARQWELSLAINNVGEPVDMTHAGDDRLFVVSKEGRIWIVVDGQKLETPFLDIRNKVLQSDEISSELGLLSMAFHPNYGENGYFFVVYTREGDGAGVLARYSVSGPDPNISPAASERTLMVVPQPGPNHNLNHVAFGPDGYLYMSSGDGGYQPEPRCTGQDGGVFLGKILRLDVDTSSEVAPYYTVPADNPFVDDPSVLDEIWALGLRNPWRFDWDSETDDLWITDVGHHLREEINFLPAGSPGGDNFGFKIMEGSVCTGSTDKCTLPVPPCFDPAYTMPVIDYGRDELHCAIIGGPVYRGAAVPEMQGSMLGADFCGATFLAHHNPDGTFEIEELSADLERVVAFGEDVDKEAYVISNDAIYKITRLANDASVAFDQAEWSIAENGGQATISVSRSGDAEGPGSVDYSVEPVSASADDYQPTAGTLSWADGEEGAKTFTVAAVDDLELEGSEKARLVLSNAVGVDLGVPSRADLVIEDDELGGGPCLESSTTLCLGNSGRFRVTATWRDFEGQVGAGNAVSLTPLGAQLEASGLMWFFTNDNMEVLVKVLDACAINDHYWVYLSAATDVEYNIQVIDTQSGVLKEYPNALGVASPATSDTEAFDCP